MSFLKFSYFPFPRELLHFFNYLDDDPKSWNSPSHPFSVNALLRKIRFLENSSHFQFLYHKIYNRHVEYGEVEAFIKEKGLKAFRNRFILTYINFFLYEEFSDERHGSDLEEILSLEEELEPYLLEQNNFLFLFLFYLKITTSRVGNSYKRRISELIPYLKVKPLKGPYSDWYLLMLLHFQEFCPNLLQKEFLQKSPKYNSLWEALLENERQIFLTNIIHYSRSTQNSSILSKELLF